MTVLVGVMLWVVGAVCGFLAGTEVCVWMSRTYRKPPQARGEYWDRFRVDRRGKPRPF